MMNKNLKNKIQKKKYKQQINFFYNSDIDKRNIDKKNMIRSSIVKFLSKSGELTAAKFVSKELSFSKKLSEINANKELTKESKRISLMDSKIVNLLGQIKSELQSQKKSNKQSSTQSVKTNDNKKPSNSLQRSNNTGQKNDKQTNIKISGNGELLINGKSVGKIKSNSEKLENKKDISANNKTENKPEEKNSKPVNTDEKEKDKKSKPEKTSSANNKFTEDRLKKIRKVTDLTKYKDIKVNTKKEQKEKDKLLFQMDEENKKIRKERQEKARRYKKLEDRLLLRELENEEIENQNIDNKEKIKEKDKLNKDKKDKEKDKKHEKIQDKKINVSDKTFNERVKAADEKNSQRDKLGNKIKSKKEKGFLSKLLKTPKNGSKIDRKLQEFKERKKLSSLNPANKIIYKTGIGARNIGSNLATAGIESGFNFGGNLLNGGLNLLKNLVSDGKMIAGTGAAALTGLGRKMLIRTGGGALLFAAADTGYNLYKRWDQSDIDKGRYGKIAANVTAALGETANDIIDIILPLIPHGEEFGKQVSKEMMDLFGIKETQNIKEHGLIAGVIDDLKKDGFGFTKEEMIDYLKSGAIKDHVEEYMSKKYDKFLKYIDSPEFQKDVEDFTGYKKTLAYDNYLKMEKSWNETKKEWEDFNFEKWTSDTVDNLTNKITETLELKDIANRLDLDIFKEKLENSIRQSDKVTVDTPNIVDQISSNAKKMDKDELLNTINKLGNGINEEARPGTKITVKDEKNPLQTTIGLIPGSNRFIYDKIISYTKYGDYKVTDWNKVFALETNELLVLLKTPKLNKDDGDKIMKEVEYRNLTGVKAVDQSVLSDKSLDNVGLSNEDILATNLYIAKTEYEQFLLDNPFTKENSKEVTVKLANGKSTKETRYKDDGTQETFLRLKSEYDDSYKKYLEFRRQQIEDMSDEMQKQLIDVQGEKLTPEQFKDWSNNSRIYGNNINNYIQSQAVVKGSSDVYYNKLKLDKVTSEDAPDTSGMGGIMAYIKAKESFKPYAYDDNGHKSIGYGHQIQPGENFPSTGITREEADNLFANDFPKYLGAAKVIPGYDIAPQDVKDALIDMTYNMGAVWWKKWTDDKGNSTIANNLQKQDYKAIVESIKNSKYATQVGVRARENIARFLKGANEVGDAKKLAETPATKTSSAEISSPETQNTQNQSNVNKPDGSKKLDKEDAANGKMNNDQKVEETSQRLEHINMNLNNINIINKNNNQTNVQKPEDKKENPDKGLLSTFVL